MASYDYEEGYFSKGKKLDYWKRKKVFDEKHLKPLVDPEKYTLNAGSGLFVEKDVLGLNKVVCADISAAAVKKLRKQGVKAVQANLMEKWPFTTGKFEQVLVLDTLEHLGHVEFFLSELNRVTRLGGVVVLGIPLLNHWRNHLKLMMGSTSGVQYDEHPRMFFDSDIKALFAANGFALEKAVYIGMTKGYGYYRFAKTMEAGK